MNINKLLKKLGLPNDGRYENKFYILPVADSNEYAKMYTLNPEFYNISACNMRFWTFCD